LTVAPANVDSLVLVGSSGRAEVRHHLSVLDRPQPLGVPVFVVGRRSAKDLNVIGSDRAYRTDEVGQQMRSNMRERLSPEFCRSVCQVIAKAYTTTTSWSSIKRALMGPLLKEELRCVEQMLKERNAKLPALTLDSDGLPVPSNWWAAQAVSFLASTEDDPDRKIDLQYAAGKFLTKTP